MTEQETRRSVDSWCRRNTSKWREKAGDVAEDEEKDKKEVEVGSEVNDEGRDDLEEENA